ncbi:MAG: hypothetical protein CMB80_08260 [Flammeovirgaceae bacterium]|nr:hypothetical protein [Flammeovirgaceae bacterium]
MRFKILFMCLVWSIPFLTIGQDLSKSLVYREGDKLFESGQYVKAMRFYKDVLDQEPGHLGALFQMGECYRLTFDYESALYYYEKVSKEDDSRFPLAKFYYAEMLKHEGEFNWAVQAFEEFMDHLKAIGMHEDERYRRYYKQGRVEKEGCILALNDLTNPKPDHNFERCSDDINTEYMDFAAFAYGDEGEYLCLTSSRTNGRGNLIDYRFGESFADIYRYKKNGERWEPYSGSDKLEKMVNTKWGDGSGSFNRDGSKFYYTNCNDELEDVCHIYVTTKVKGEWTEPVSLGEGVNMAGYDSRHPNVSPSGDTLFFASNRPGGYGEYDIWMSLNAGGENWSNAENLGNQINTPFFEVSPFYDANQKALFFSSDGHRGYGGFDIFLAKGFSFLDPEIFNPGSPFNTNRDEIFMFLTKDKGYLSSNREGGAGRLDIYEFDINNEQEIITEISSEESIAGRQSLFSDDYDFDSDKEAEIREIISNMLAAKIIDVNLIMTDELSKLYKGLSLDDKERINRIIYARVRKLNDNDIRALRIEDEFYYRDLASTDKHHMDNLVMKYIEERDLALSVNLDAEERRFYDNLEIDKRETVDHLLATRVKEASKINYIPRTYQSLDAPEQKRVDQIAYNYFDTKSEIDQLALNPNLAYYLKQLDDTKKSTVYQSVKEKVMVMADDPKYQLSEDDRVFYQNMSTEHLEALKRIASAFIVSAIDNLAINLDPKDINFYKLYTQGQKDRLNRILAKVINNTIKADMYFAELNLTADQKEKVKTISAKDVSTFISKGGSINDQTDQLRIKRFVTVSAPSWNPKKPNFTTPELDEPEVVAKETPQKSSIKETSTNPSTQEKSITKSSPDDKPEVEVVSAQAEEATKPVIDTSDKEVTSESKPELIASETNPPDSNTNNQTPDETTKAVATEIAPIVEKEQKISTMTEEDVQFYVDLDTSKQKTVDRIIAMEYINEQYKDAKKVDEDDAYLKSLGVSQKTYLSLLVSNMKGESVSLEEESITREAFAYYSGLAPSLKSKWNRLVAREALVKDGQRYKIYPTDAKYRISMTDTEKEGLQKLKNLRFENQRILSENILVERNDDVASSVNFSVAKFENDNYNYISAQGKLFDNETGKPKSNFPVEVKNKDGKTIAKAITNEEGKFIFEDIPNGQFQVVAGDSDTKRGSGSVGASFFVKDLKVEGTESGKYQYSVNTNIYFDFDSYQLRPEAVIALKEIADYYKKGELYIQLKSHSDNVGNEDYNLNLSKLRNDQALGMLKGLGVKVENMEWLAIGQSSPVASNDNPFGRQFNRRIEIQLKSNKPIDFQPVETYLIRPKGTLYSISRNFHVSIEDIQKCNGLLDTGLKAFHPLRVPNPDNVRPNLDMLVELNESVVMAENSYTVRKGETVTSIAEKFNVPEELIIEMNALEGVELKEGQKLKLYIRGN